MARVYQFRRREKTLREMIETGRITARLRECLEEAHHRHELLYPDDPDTAWIERLLSFRGRLGPEEQRRLLELLKYEIAEEEHPHGILAMRLF